MAFRHLAWVLAAALAAPVAGCGLFGSDEDEVAADLPAEAVVRRDPVTEVLSIEIGRTRNGFAITAYGTAPALGYAEPQLRARRDGRPAADGFLDYDFLAQAPAAGLNYGTGTAEARRVRADLFLRPDNLSGVAGIRIHAARGGLQIVF